MAISAPASASALAVAFAGSRTSTRTGTSRSREQAGGFGADLPGRCHKDHGEPPPLTQNGLREPTLAGGEWVVKPRKW